MVDVKITNPSGKNVGIYDTNLKTYFRTLDYAKSEIFFNFDNGLAISKSIIKRLFQLGCEKLQFTILNFPLENKKKYNLELNNKPFIAIISIIDFMNNKEEIHYENKENSDKQYRVGLSFWKLIETDQIKIDAKV